MPRDLNFQHLPEVILMHPEVETPIKGVARLQLSVSIFYKPVLCSPHPCLSKEWNVGWDYLLLFHN